MATVIRNRRGDFEIRESFRTAYGPRSRTLATFKLLDDDVLARAASAAQRPFDRAAVRLAALRAGASEAESAVEAAARILLRELDRNRPIRPALVAALREALASRPSADVAGIGHSATDWAADDPLRGRMTEQLGDLVDALPPHERGGEPAFPRLAQAR
jgi:hypothetical protein